MAFPGFGKQSGPANPPKSLPPFGHFTRPPSPSLPFPDAAPQRSPRPIDSSLRWGDMQKSFLKDHDAQTHQRPSAPYVALNSSGSGIPAMIPQFQDLKRTRSPPLPSADRDNSRTSGPDVIGRPIDSSSRWGGVQKPFLQDHDAQNHQRPSAVAPYVALSNSGTGIPAKIPQFQDLKRTRSPQNHQRPSAVAPYVALSNSGTSIPTKISQFQDLKRTRSPPLPSSDKDNFRNSSQNFIGSRSDMLFDNQSNLVPQKAWAPPLAFENNHSFEDLHPPFGEAQRPTLSSPALDNRRRLPVSYADLLTEPELSPVSPYVNSYDSQRMSPIELADVRYPKQTRSPPIPSSNEVLQDNSHLAQNNFRRPSISPPRMGTRSNVHTSDPQTQTSVPSAHNIDAEAAVTKPTSFPVPKRSRSPPVPSSNQVFQGNSYSTQDDTEREMQAKAKRLARFKVELSQTEPSGSETANQRFSGNRQDQAMMEKRKYVGEQSVEAACDFPNGSVLPDSDGLESSSIIIGLCPDMCPESERAERERKGDLDQYERLDGDRNQSSKSLAVKKYNRTADREADLIRPMPILQKTIDYLLDLLDQPYDDKFLGMYNFLWDRMRAIRMDLRMQHIFNLGSITMLEQMIRLHVIAMHELCEYTKGEGFSEGFDAHLNIEQMNKTSVELFQMYDDHRKKGINVPTEKEFRGYYALLKLDKHPGYKVEPAELSLDLAKMTAEIRQTPEVLFARDVARACRTVNFIAFFRHARKASYLQACLMHAHFAKLRTQALASLHCGLQNNQGVPVAHVAKWLGMEEEDIESLLEYHGFFIKDFEEPYMVKEGPFVNGDKDYPTKCSKLVHLKKSGRIIEDVSSSCQAVSLPVEGEKELQLGKVHKQDATTVQYIEAKSSAHTIDEEMPDFEAVSSLKDGTQVQPMLKTPTVGQQSVDDHQVPGVRLSPWGFSSAHNFLESQQAKVVRVERPNSEALFGNSLDRNGHHDMESTPLQIVSRRVFQDITPASQFDTPMENSVPQNVFAEDLEGEIYQEAENNELMASYQDEEAAEAKLKLILRIWRRHSSKLRELREQKLLAANAALNSLSLGLPIRQKRDEPSTLDEFNIDRVLRERYDNLERSWSKLNVSDVVVGELIRRNPGAKCLCFKIIVCSQLNNPGDKMGAGSWLLSKLMPKRKYDNDDDLVISSPGLSIWKKWVPGQAGTDLTCCLSVIKDIKFDNPNEAVLGASAVLFLVSESIPWERQKIHLHDLLMSLPSGSHLPLLILSGSCKEVSDLSSIIVNKLGLHQIDKSRISGFFIVFLVRKQQMEQLDGFFSDEQLREGLQWLASESPLQPVLQYVKTRELVLTHLNSLLKVLDETSVYEVGPNHCISAFNESLDRSLGEVAEAASANPSSWPCPEIALLEEFSDEHRAAKLYLPSIGWSSSEKIEPLNCALRDCKLPTFPDDISWLSIGSNFGKEIETQRSGLENCLIRYLTQSSKMMGLTLATNEASVMLQKNARLELHNSSFYIVPKWVMIFRRIFNWWLMSLSTEAFSAAYVLERRSVASPTSRGLDELNLEASISSTYNLLHPSLDEMVEVGCSPLLSRKGQPEPEPFQTSSGTVSNGGGVLEATNTSELMEDERNLPWEGELVETDDGTYVNSGLNNISGELVVAATTMVKKEDDKLSILLEQCSILQNMIDEKLSIFF